MNQKFVANLLRKKWSKPIFSFSKALAGKSSEEGSSWQLKAALSRYLCFHKCLDS